MSSTTYYQRNRDTNLNRAKEYYKNDKKRLREQVRDKYMNLSEEKKIKKREYGKKNRYYNISKKKKQKLKEFKNQKELQERLMIKIFKILLVQYMNWS